MLILQRLQRKKLKLISRIGSLLYSAQRLESRALAVMTGRAAFLLCDGPKCWAEEFLAATDTLNPAFVEALVEQAPSSVPPSELAK